MNNHNLVSLATRPEHERKEISRKGAIRANEVKKQKKEEAQRKNSLIEILKGFLFSEAKPKDLKKLLKSTGASENDYGSALVAATILKGIKKGDMNSLVKLIEILGESEENVKRETEADKSFNNLIEAIKNVRETK